MKKPFHILLVLAAAMMLFASGCACADITEGLIYDDTDNPFKYLLYMINSLSARIPEPPDRFGKSGIGEIQE